MSPTASVIIPTYNRSSQLKLAIQSVLRQTFEDFEILICDDGSTDETKSMVKSIQDYRIRWISGSNSGSPAAPRNRGITEAKGEWLAFLDSDDIWHPSKLEVQLNLCSENCLMAICTNAEVLAFGKISQKPYFSCAENKAFSFSDMLRLNTVICSSMMFHKSLLPCSGLFPENPKYKAIEDYALWLCISMLTNIYFVCRPLVTYRDEASNSIRGEVQTREEEKRILVLKHALTAAKRLDKRGATIKLLLCLSSLRMSSFLRSLFR